MIDKFKELVDKLDDNESSNLYAIISSLLESWEDGNINCYTEIQNFELSTIYKVLNLFKDESETKDAS
jgi:c-di-AMP phosphodiesterase-like protein